MCEGSPVAVAGLHHLILYGDVPLPHASVLHRIGIK